MTQEHLQDLDAAIEERIRLRSQPGGTSVSGHPMASRTILIVEDKADYRSLVKTQLLSHLDCRIIEAGDGRSAMAQIQREAPDLVILDFDIPKMNGYEVLQGIRSHGETRRLPVIMLTGASNRSHLRSLGLDVSDFLEKPVRGADLLESINKALEAAYGPAPGADTAAALQTQPQAVLPETEPGPRWCAASAFPPDGTILPLAAAPPGDTVPSPQQPVDYRELLRIQEEFLAELGHDLRAPLTSIYCALRLFVEKVGARLDADDQQFLDICLRNSQRLESLIRDIFNFRGRRLSGGTPCAVTPTVPAAAAAPGQPPGRRGRC
jgi:CheY-like chemotaxis protein